MKAMAHRLWIPLALATAAISAAGASAPGATAGQPKAGASAVPDSSAHANRSLATFAGGCFWCMQPPFENLKGVISVTVGYTGGKKVNPTYEEVSTGTTGHAESIQVVYDSTKVSYARLLDVFWRNIDPLTRDRQFCDHGSQYRTAIFYHDEEQHRLAQASKEAWDHSGRFDRPIVTEIVPASVFYVAEEYHQNFHEKDAARYEAYREGCGRDKRLRQLWGGAPATP